MPFIGGTTAPAHPGAAGRPGVSLCLGRAGAEGGCLGEAAPGDERLPGSAVPSFEGALTGCQGPASCADSLVQRHPPAVATL